MGDVLEPPLSHDKGNEESSSGLATSEVVCIACVAAIFGLFIFCIVCKFGKQVYNSCTEKSKVKRQKAKLHAKETGKEE